MPKKAKQVKTSLYLEADALEKLKQISEKTMIPMARLLRKAVHNIIKEYSK
jgi:predicted DNA-binding protein